MLWYFVCYYPSLVFSPSKVLKLVVPSPCHALVSRRPWSSGKMSVGLTAKYRLLTRHICRIRAIYVRITAALEKETDSEWPDCFTTREYSLWRCHSIFLWIPIRVTLFPKILCKIVILHNIKRLFSKKITHLKIANFDTSVAWYNFQF